MDIMQMKPEDFGPVPWQCWEAPGFKDCNTEAGNVTYRKLKSVGVVVDSPEWKIMYPEQVRREVYRCQILSNCVPDLIAQDLKKKTGGSSDADILKRLEAEQGASSGGGNLFDNITSWKPGPRGLLFKNGSPFQGMSMDLSPSNPWVMIAIGGALLYYFKVKAKR